jgi:hypothetical protein
MKDSSILRVPWSSPGSIDKDLIHFSLRQQAKARSGIFPQKLNFLLLVRNDLQIPCNARRRVAINNHEDGVKYTGEHLAHLFNRPTRILSAARLTEIKRASGQCPEKLEPSRKQRLADV